MHNVETLITLSHVGKSYPTARSAIGRLHTVANLLVRKPLPHSFAALSDINLEVHRGESLGLVGVNGAGKSTLLKIVAGVVRPSTGRVDINGRISALLELGAGFHPEYTGRQNVFLATALMGLSEPQTRERLDEILAFADIGEHIDQPIKQYSSGMVVRLGFAVSTVVRPDVLITDEVLAVGDESFQRKCIRWMEDFLAGGGTLLLCSHSMFHIEKLCQKAAWIHAGRLHAYGASKTVTRDYLAWHDARSRPRPQAAGVRKQGAGGECAVSTLTVNGVAPGEDVVVAAGQSLVAQGSIYCPEDRAPIVLIGIATVGDAPIYGLSSDMDGYRLPRLRPREFGFRIQFPELALLPGRYEVRAHAMDPEGYRVFDEVRCALIIEGASREIGHCRLEHSWGDPVQSS
ncbi:MAG: ATP-binding cassette domain-containing protein [Chromatiaceae bacterium]|nr:ATP-binding cassette domain-containing protein [Chromatiaceae bacterium]